MRRSPVKPSRIPKCVVCGLITGRLFVSGKAHAHPTSQECIVELRAEVARLSKMLSAGVGGSVAKRKITIRPPGGAFVAEAVTAFRKRLKREARRALSGR